MKMSLKNDNVFIYLLKNDIVGYCEYDAVCDTVVGIVARSAVLERISVPKVFLHKKNQWRA